MSKDLVIVESPTKARTIQKILGPGHTIMASMGHVRDLPRKRFGVDIENGFTPEYTTVNGRKVLPKLRKAAKEASTVYLAPDPDREGEAIAWHIKEALKLPDEKVRRVTFHEITPRAVSEAFERAGSLDMNKVNAQQARRILDRLVGYKISPLLWKKVAKGLSAGRVQSVALRLIVEREKEIETFQPREYWKITARFLRPGPFDALLEKVRHPFSSACPYCGTGMKESSRGKTTSFRCASCGKSFRTTPDRKFLLEDAEIPDEHTADGILAELGEAHFRVESFSTAETKASPIPPFNTSQMQQTANIRYGFSASRTMRIAQSLYEGVDIAGESTGLITYMRTDSLRVAQEAVREARDFISETLGPEYVPPRPPRFKSRKGAQEAHEAIRPTSVVRTPEALRPYLNEDQFKLYDLIWRRFLASQTAPARFLEKKAEISAGKYLFSAKGRSVKFQGAMKFWPSASSSPSLPDLNEGDALKAEELVPSQHFTQPPPRYTEASLVRTLEREGIGRPSTYANIISTLYRRGYAIKKNRRFYPTELGRLVAEKLIRHFPSIMDVGFTAQMEEELDQVEEARLDWKKVLEDFWSRLSAALEEANKEMASVKNEEFPGESCPECGGPMVVRYSRKGKFLGCKQFPKCKGTKPLPRGDGEEARPSSVPLDEQCPQCGRNLVLRHSRKGPFIGCSGYPECRFTKPIEEEDRPASAEEAAQEEAAS